jgi:pyridoxal phosphate enzyme (YggS family)
MSADEVRTILRERLAAVRERIAAACARAGGGPQSVTLVAVTKTVDVDVAGMLPELGVFDLGEGRPQELWHKAEALKAVPIRWHLVGHLQRNKVERSLPLAHMIHSLDSLRLLREVAAEAAKQKVRPRVLLQVNASHEEQKHGFEYEELLAAAAEIREAPLDVQGLMAMAAYSDNPEEARPAFRGMREFRDRLREATGLPLGQLSMGMSGDFEVAIEEGATLVRIGTTLFEGLSANR